MTQPLRNILRLTLATTSEKTAGKAFSLNNRCYYTGNQDDLPPRGCLPWETSVKKRTCRRLDSKCICPPKKPIKPKKHECGKTEKCPEISQCDELDLTTSLKTYPMGEAVVKMSLPGAPVPGWEEIQKSKPKKPDNC